MWVNKRLMVFKSYHGMKSFSSSVCPKKIGFIGLGIMGSQMVNNLLKKGVEVTVYDISESAVSSAVAAGAKKASSPAELASVSKHLITMLPSSPNVKDAYLGKNGILSGAQPGSLFIDSSTIDAEVSREMEKHVLNKNSTFMDAPVSGGVLAAKDGTLTFMVGGIESAVDDTKVILEKMGKNIVYCGPSGTGQAAKICNNMLLGISMIGTAETMNLGLKLGLDAKVLTSIINTSSGQCWSSLKYNPCPGVLENVPASNDYAGGFGTGLMTKDLGLAQNAATATLSPIPLGSLAHQIYRMMCNGGFATKDFSSVYLFLQQLEKKSGQ